MSEGDVSFIDEAYFNNRNEDDVYNALIRVLDKYQDTDSLINPKDLVYYPKVLSLWLQYKDISSETILVYVQRIIERRLKTYDIIFNHLKNIGYKHDTNDDNMMLRCNLIFNLNDDWIDKLNQLKEHFGLYDKEFDNVRSSGISLCNVNIKTKKYDYPTLEISPKYYSYRRALHLLTYADIKYRKSLYEHFKKDSLDCVYSAFEDYYNFVNSKELPNLTDNIKLLKKYLFECH